MSDYTLTVFADGDTLLAQPVNDNFQYCLQDTTTKVGALQTSVQSSINSINGNISNIETSISGLTSDALTGANTKYITASATVNRILTATALSKATNGYVKFGNGIIIQWGGIASGSTSRTINLSTAFSNGDYTVVIGERRGDVPTRNIVVSARNTTSFNVLLGDNSTSGNWLAIGY